MLGGGGAPTDFHRRRRRGFLVGGGGVERRRRTKCMQQALYLAHINGQSFFSTVCGAVVDRFRRNW
jgi:hypothetical protein